MSVPDPRFVFSDVASQDVEDIATEGGGWSGRIVQVSRGVLDYRSRRLALAGIELRQHECNQVLATHWQNALGAVSIVWGDPLAARASYYGHELRGDMVLCQHARREHRVRVPDGFRGWEIEVSAAVRSRRGWRVTLEPLRPVGRATRQALDRLCEGAFAAAQRGASGNLGTHALRDAVLDALERLLPELVADEHRTSVFPVSMHAQRELIRAAIQTMGRAATRGDAVRVGSVARHLGVSERSLYLAFQDQLGVGPYAIHQLDQLHRFREALALSHGGRGSVTSAAASVGFGDPARLARVYRRQFGESPRQTLARWAGQKPRRFRAS